MNDNINKDEIRRAIDRLQTEHPAHFIFDLTMFDKGTDFSAMQRAIDVIAKKCADDTDIHIICEMAKLYLDGVKPTVERPHGEWIYHKHDKDFECSMCHYRFDEDEFGLEIPQENGTWVKVCVYNFCPNCGADMKKEGEAK